LTDTVYQKTTSNDTLPATWVWSEIGEIAELIRGVSYKKSDASSTPRPGLLPILRANNIGDGKLNFDELIYVPPQEISEKQYVRALDVVIAMSSGSKKLVGKAGQATSDFDGGFGAFCGLVRTSELLDKRYVGFFFQSEIYRKAISEQSSGVNINNLRRQHIEQMPIPLAPLNEQRRIVEKIEELFTKLDAGVRSLEQARAQLKTYRRSVLKAAVEGELSREWREAHRDELEPASELLERILQERRERVAGKKYKEPASPDTSRLPTLPEGWTWAKSDQLFHYVTSGSRGWAKYYSAEGPTFLRIGNLDHDSIALDLRNIQHVQPPEGGEGTRSRIATKDILISITAYVGMIAVIPPDFREAYINQHIALARPSHRMNIDYLAWYLVSEPGNKQLTGRQYGATKPGLNLDDIRSVHVPIPPLEEQRFVVEEIERRLSVVDKLEATVEANIKQANGLRQSILKRAFSGELVPQNPDDEPASVLLERIRDEREATKPKASRGRGGKTGPTNREHAEQEGLF
jgi:type I restriction enzyme S subunit